LCDIINKKSDCRPSFAFGSCTDACRRTQNPSRERPPAPRGAGGFMTFGSIDRLEQDPRLGRTSSRQRSQRHASVCDGEGSKPGKPGLPVPFEPATPSRSLISTKFFLPNGENPTNSRQPRLLRWAAITYLPEALRVTANLTTVARPWYEGNSTQAWPSHRAVFMTAAQAELSIA
jgi:hypothetical protein